MSQQAIFDRIISDAEEEARAIIRAAEEKAAKTVEQAEKLAERDRLGAEAEIAEKIKGISDGKAASARLDAAKILLGEKRGVIDEIYSRALACLVNLEKPEAIAFAESLLSEYAEEGDEVTFAENFRYKAEVAALPIVVKKKLRVSPKSADIDGGFILRGVKSDKNLSYGAILSADREERQAEIAEELFLLK